MNCLFVTNKLTPTTSIIFIITSSKTTKKSKTGRLSESSFMVAPERHQFLMHSVYFAHSLLRNCELLVIAWMVQQVLAKFARLHGHNTLHPAMLTVEQLETPGPELDVIPNPAILHCEWGEKPTWARFVEHCYLLSICHPPGLLRKERWISVFSWDGCGCVRASPNAAVPRG